MISTEIFQDNFSYWYLSIQTGRAAVAEIAIRHDVPSYTWDDLDFWAFIEGGAEQPGVAEGAAE